MYVQLQGFLLVIDDIQDKSQIRRNQPCWYLFDDIGLAAINDGFMIENTIYQILKLYFKEKEYYVDLVELFHEVCTRLILFIWHVKPLDKLIIFIINSIS